MKRYKKVAIIIGIIIMVLSCSAIWLVMTYMIKSNVLMTVITCVVIMLLCMVAYVMNIVYYVQNRDSQE